jgi:endonuclease YncB( thermonuclease family)
MCPNPAGLGWEALQKPCSLRRILLSQRGVGVALVPVLRWLALIARLACAEQFAGKVVGINDGDTRSGVREGKSVKVRLHGVDTPEAVSRGRSVA